MRLARQQLPLVLVLLVCLVAGGWSTAFAQDATPAADDMSMEGLTFIPFGWADEVTLPNPAYLEVARVGFEPGAGFPLDPGDPSSAMVVVESGEITATVVEQSWIITRGSAMQQAMSTPGAMPDMSNVQEVVAMGEEATLSAGDTAYIQGGVTGEVRNIGQEPAWAIVFLISPSGMMTGATPAP